MGFLARSSLVTLPAYGEEASAAIPAGPIRLSDRSSLLLRARKKAPASAPIASSSTSWRRRSRRSPTPDTLARLRSLRLAGIDHLDLDTPRSLPAALRAKNVRARVSGVGERDGRCPRGAGNA